MSMRYERETIMEWTPRFSLHSEVRFLLDVVMCRYKEKGPRNNLFPTNVAWRTMRNDILMFWKVKIVWMYLRQSILLIESMALIQPLVGEVTIWCNTKATSILCKEFFNIDTGNEWWLPRKIDWFLVDFTSGENPGKRNNLFPTNVAWRTIRNESLERNENIREYPQEKMKILQSGNIIWALFDHFKFLPLIVIRNLFRTCFKYHTLTSSHLFNEQTRTRPFSTKSAWIIIFAW